MVYCNYPPSHEIPFNRTVFYGYKAAEVQESYHLTTVWQVDLPVIERAGSFDYYLERSIRGIYEKVKSQIRTFVVDPILGNKIPTEGIVLQSVLTKCLGPDLEDDLWRKILRNAASINYNVVHFTPIQELGESKSAYSLYDHHSISPQLSPKQRKGSNLDINVKTKTLKQELEKLRNGHELYFITDVVWNHTANNTPWLLDHPESGYNLENSPHLKVAYELDARLIKFSNDIIEGKYPSLSPQIYTEDKLNQVMNIFRNEIWIEMRLWEYFVVDVDKTVQEFKRALGTHTGNSWVPHSQDLVLIDNETGERFSKHIRLDDALGIFGTGCNANSQQDIENRCNRLRDALNRLNLPLYEQLNRDLDEICKNLAEQIRYQRIAQNGPKKGTISFNTPLFEPYFTVITTKHGTSHPLAHNGWIWGHNPLINFAEKESKAYFLRQIVVWSDCVKLRYGDSRQSSPWLWDYMTTYTTWMASTFSGFRIDNCHSTPLHVAQHFLDAARQIYPNLLVIAELFTGSPELDSYYAVKLGINALIREAMNAPDTHELGRLVFQSGGTPVGSIRRNDPTLYLTSNLPGSVFFDCTHDNETPAQKRLAQDALSTSAIVAMSYCAVGSTRGYDELHPTQINLITETRHYQIPPNNIGIIEARAILNKLHKNMACQGYEEIFVNQTGNVLTIQRHHPKTCEAYYAIIRPAFPNTPDNLTWEESVVTIPAKIDHLIVAARLSVPPQKFIPNLLEINGLQSTLFISTTETKDFCTVNEETEGDHRVNRVKLQNFPKGSVIVFKTSPFPGEHESLFWLMKFFENADHLNQIFESVSFTDLNILLYRCEAEELATTDNGTYDIPKYGKLPYCGIASIYRLLQQLEERNDLGHPLFHNLRAGNWLMQNIVDRLSQAPNLSGVRQWLHEAFDLVEKLPRHLIPKYFDQVIKRCYHAAEGRAKELFSPLIKTSSNSFLYDLALGSIQMFGIIPNAPLLTNKLPASMAAGLPHFATGYMRNWGRDTFISLRGLFLVTGRFEDAKNIILAGASCLRHGLIPNLLDGGNSPRYNARDATWFFLQSVQDYYFMAPNGKDILQEKVERRFPSDSILDREKGLARTDTIAQVIQEIMEKHANGIHFREWYAGATIDSKMQYEGFNVDITLDLNSGIIFGGNAFNCGTWMDKMGESEQFGNIGIPATPRDGAAIEIIGLLKSTLRWLENLASQGIFSEGVKLQSKIFTYSEWNDLLQKNFENYFWVPETQVNDNVFRINSKIVHRRGIYRDTHGSSSEYTDYQLRPNLCIAMAVAPELFNPKHAENCLQKVETILVGPLGMKTLDPADLNYSPNYNNGDNSSRKTARGFNYHQGPEWLWPLGFFLRAVMNFDQERNPLHFVHYSLNRHREHIKNSIWCGLPELTNQNGADCYDSCPTQAWSFATLLDTYYDLHVLLKNSTQDQNK